MNNTNLETKRLGDLEPGQYFYLADLPKFGLHVRARIGSEMGRVRLEKGCFNEDIGPLSTRIPVLPVESVTDTFEDAEEQNTPAPLTFGDLEAGARFRPDYNTALHIKVNTGWPGETSNAVALEDGPYDILHPGDKVRIPEDTIVTREES